MTRSTSLKKDGNSLAAMKDTNLLSDEIQKEVTKAITERSQKSEVSGVGQITSGDSKETTAYSVKLTPSDYPCSCNCPPDLFFPLKVTYCCLFRFLCSGLAIKNRCLDPRATFIAT